MAKVSPMWQKKFGRLEIVSQGPRRFKGRLLWLCLCKCGIVKWIRGDSIRRGLVVSCGCQGLENRIQAIRTHGLTHTPEYKAWYHMHDRCYNGNCESYTDYGARGIRVCVRWKNFENFLADMGMRPSRNHSLNRQDNDGSYSPLNCNWATKREQAANRRPNLRIEKFSDAEIIVEYQKRGLHGGF